MWLEPVVGRGAERKQRETQRGQEHLRRKRRERGVRSRERDNGSRREVGTLERWEWENRNRTGHMSAMYPLDVLDVQNRNREEQWGGAEWAGAVKGRA